MAWPTQDFHASPAVSRALDVAGGIIRQRLMDGLRETDGATYSPKVRTTASETLDAYGYLAVTVEIPPEKIPLFRDRLDGIVSNLRRVPVSEDELERAKQPMIRRRTAQIQNEEYWLDLLITRPLDMGVREMLRTRIYGVKAVIAEDVRAVVDRYLSKPTFAIQVTAAPPQSP